MWWILAACLGAGLIGLELRRFLRERAAERGAPRRYALYRASDPERALAIVEVGPDDAAGWPVAGDAPPAPAAEPGLADAGAGGGDAPPLATGDDAVAGDPGPAGATRLPVYARRHHPPTSGGRRG